MAGTEGDRRPKRLSREGAARWQPSSGIFGPTTGLDQRLFGPGGELRPEVREAVMARLDQALRVDSGLAGSDWQQWARVYLAGGSASEWAGNRPNEAAQDLDVLLGVDYGAARASSPALSRMDDAQVDAALNAALRSGFNESGWTPGFGGTWDLTGYVNHAAFDVRAIKPYAAYDVSGGHWAVRPPHLPSHSLADFDPAVLAQARALASEARAILRMPEPLRTREARALWERIHAERSQAFSDAGEGWTDPGNVAEKWLAYAPGELLRRIRELALADSGTKTAFLANVEAMGESAAHEPEDEPAVRDEGDLGWGAHEWATARRAPWHAAAWLAQREVRLSHPKTTMEFPHGDEGDRMVGHLLRYAGYPEHRLGGAFAVPHRHPERGNSNPAWDADGFPGVALHPDRWDYGTAAHEASHHVVLYNNGRGPNTPQTDEQVHGREWAGHYAMALNKISRNAGDDFLYHHQRFHDMIQAGLGRQDPAALDAAEQRLPASRWIREGAADEAPATTVRMVPPAEYGKYEYPDYPVKTLPALARHFKRTNPAYWQALRDDVQANGVQAPVLARFTMAGRPLRRPRMMDGHNRAAVAYELGLHIPVGDYDNQADYDAAAPHGREWFGQHQELKAQGVPPWRAEGARREAVTGYDGLTGRSAMIYLDLPEGAVRHVKGGVDDHHITIVYLGKNVSDRDFAEACRRAREAAARTPPLAGFISGIDTFEPSGSSDGKVPAFVPAYLPGVGELRRLLEDLSASEHRHHRPHVTLGYFGEGEDLPDGHPTVPVSFGRLHVKRGDEVTSYPFGGRQVTAAAAPAAGPWYHGSGKRYRDGDLIDPAEPHKKIHPQSDPSQAYFSDSPWNAQRWGDVASRSGQGYAYEVEPTGDHEEDPHYSGDEERGCYDLSASPPRRVDVRRTGAPLRVIRRLPRQD